MVTRLNSTRLLMSLPICVESLRLIDDYRHIDSRGNTADFELA